MASVWVAQQGRGTAAGLKQPFGIHEKSCFGQGSITFRMDTHSVAKKKHMGC